MFLASRGAVHSSSKWPKGRRNKSDHQRQQAGCWLRAPCPHQLLQAMHGPQVGARLGAGTGVMRAKALGRLVLSPKKSDRARVLMGGTTGMAFPCLPAPPSARGTGPGAGVVWAGSCLLAGLEEQVVGMSLEAPCHLSGGAQGRLQPLAACS